MNRSCWRPGEAGTAGLASAFRFAASSDIRRTTWRRIACSRFARSRDRVSEETKRDAAIKTHRRQTIGCCVLCRARAQLSRLVWCCLLGVFSSEVRLLDFSEERCARCLRSVQYEKDVSRGDAESNKTLNACLRHAQGCDSGLRAKVNRRDHGNARVGPINTCAHHHRCPTSALSFLLFLQSRVTNGS